MKKKELESLVSDISEDLANLEIDFNNIKNELAEIKNEQNKKISLKEQLNSDTNTKVKTFTISHTSAFEFGSQFIYDAINNHFPGIDKLTVKELKE